MEWESGSMISNPKGGSRMGELTRLLRLIGPIPKKWLIKVCEEIKKLATGCRMCEKHACKHCTKYTHTHTNTYFI